MTNHLPKITLATLFALTAATTLASAVENSSNNVSGIFLTGGVGTGAYQSANSNSNSGFMSQVGSGYLYALPHYNQIALGGELSATFYPSIKETSVLSNNTTTTVTNYSFNLLGVARYFINDQWSVAGKMGPSFFQSNLSVASNGFTYRVPTSNSSVGFMTDIGLAYHLNPMVALTMDFNYSWQKFDFAGFESETFSPYGILGGININFGGM